MATSGGKQAGGSVAGALIIAASADAASSSEGTPVTYDGNPVTITCTNDNPPEWLDDASNIILPGLYWIGTALGSEDAATTPGLSGNVTRQFLATTFPVDALDAFEELQVGDVLSLSAGDVPYAVSIDVTVQTDITGTCTASGLVLRLASATT